MKGTSTTALVLASTTAAVSAFSVLPAQNTNTARCNTELYGLFDGVKDAFTQPPSSLDAERETPIDRWMGWSVVSENDVKETVEPVGTFHMRMKTSVVEISADGVNLHSLNFITHQMQLVSYSI